MENKIFLRQVLKKIDERLPDGNPGFFDLEVRLLNKNNKTGGAYRVYKSAKLLIGDKMKGKRFDEATHFYRQHRSRKNPNHWEHATRNFELPNGQVKKIKVRYIIKINGLEVVY